MPAQGEAETTWRPTAQSFVNLAAFLGVLAAASAVALGLTDSGALVGVTAGLALVVGLGITAVLTRPRLAGALAQAEHPDLGNWPGTDEDRRRLRSAGWARARRNVAMAAVMGGLCGFYPVLGVACVGAGVAGALSAAFIARKVAAFEVANDVTVMTPSAPGGRRPSRGRLHFGIADGRM